MTKQTKPSTEQMQTAFSTVSNKKDWKMPIDKVIANPGQEALELLETAIIEFTGSIPNIDIRANGKVRVTAPGYYAMEMEILGNCF